MKKTGLPGGPVVKTPCSLCRGSRFNHWSGNKISHITTKSLHATAKIPCTSMKIEDPA